MHITEAWEHVSYRRSRFYDDRRNKGLLSRLYCIAQNDKTIGGWIGKDLEGSGHGLEVLALHLSEGTEDNYEELRLGWDMNRAPAECKSRALPQAEARRAITRLAQCTASIEVSTCRLGASCRGRITRAVLHFLQNPHSRKKPAPNHGLVCAEIDMNVRPLRASNPLGGPLGRLRPLRALRLCGDHIVTSEVGNNEVESCPVRTTDGQWCLSTKGFFPPSHTHTYVSRTELHNRAPLSTLGAKHLARCKCVTKDGKGKGGTRGRIGFFPYALSLGGAPHPPGTTAGFTAHVRIYNGQGSRDIFLHTLNGRNIPFVNSVKYLGVIFAKKSTWRPHIGMIEAKAFRTFPIQKWAIKR
jgi:hypothetical protein